MSFLSHHAHNIQKQITCQLNTFPISLKTHAIKVSITMFRVRDVVLRNVLCFPTTKLTLTFLCLFSQPSLVTDDVFAFYAISCYYFFFSKGSVFNTTQICCCCSENSRSSGILWTMLLFLRDQYTCLHTNHFIQFNLTIKHKHLWRTFLAFKIIFAGACAYDDRKRSYQLTICFQNILQ